MKRIAALVLGLALALSNMTTAHAAGVFRVCVRYVGCPGQVFTAQNPLLVSSNGKLVEFFFDVQTDANYSGFMIERVSTDNGKTWLSEQNLGQLNTPSYMQASADAAGNIVLLWGGIFSGVNVTYYQVSSDSGATWTAGSGMMGFQFMPGALTVSPSGVFAYIAASDNSSDVAVNYSKDHGVTWLTKTVTASVTQSADEYWLGQLATASFTRGNILNLAIAGGANGLGHIQQWSCDLDSNDGSGSPICASPTTLSLENNSNYASRYPQIVSMKGSNVGIVWAEQGSVLNDQVVASISHDDGHTWSTPFTVGGFIDPAVHRVHAVGTASGDMAVTWDSWTMGPNWRVREVNVSSSGTVSPFQQLSSDSTEAFISTLTRAPSGELASVWMETYYDQGATAWTAPKIMRSTSSNNGKSWSAPSTIGTTPESFPSFAGHEDDGALASVYSADSSQSNIWLQYATDHYSVGSYYSETTPAVATSHKTKFAKVIFAYRSAQLSTSTKKRLAKLAMGWHDAKKIVIEGYTQTNNRAPLTVAANRKLAKARAAVVSSFLRAHGVHAKITVIARGPVKPVSTKNQALNRRVEIHVTWLMRRFGL